jgi:hypothetical protein
VSRGAVLAILLVAGLGVIIGVSAAVAGQDNAGQTVSAASWADDVCGAVGAWEGQVEAIGDELAQSNYAARRSDGATGDSVERTLLVRGAIDRALQATQDTLREGLKRAGSPEGNNGQAGALAMRAWALKTELELRVAKSLLRKKPSSTSSAYAALGAATAVLRQSVIDGRATFNRVAASNPAIGDALHGSENCQELMEEQP